MLEKVMNEFIEVSNIYMELIGKTEKVKRNYNGIELYPSEVHTLVFIQEHNQMNMTSIAQKLCVTKGAIFKIIQKLEKKELLKRYKKLENNKNTYFELMEKGLMAYQGHKKFHEDFFEKPPAPFLKFAADNEAIILSMFEFTKEYLIKHIEKIDEEL